jgi:HEAT repeat protein
MKYTILLVIVCSFLIPQFGYSGDVNIETFIHDVMSDNRDIRTKAARALGELKDVRAVEPLIAALKYEEPRSYVDVINALVEIGAPAVDPLISALKGEDQIIRGNAVRAIRKTKDPGALKMLISALEDENSLIRENAAWALGRKRDRRAVKALSIALKDKDSNVRRAAAWALGRIENHGVVILALKDEDLHVRESAAWALRLTKDERSIDPLIMALEDKNQRVRSVAASALKQLSGENFGKDVSKWQMWMKQNKETVRNRK